MIQKHFAEKVVDLARKDDNIIGIAAAGSWITGELDEYSDLDLVLITREKIGGDKEKMMNYAHGFGNFISGFTGEHVGEPRVLICLYDEPLLHVDLKFLTLPEFEQRVEDPTILFEKEGQLSNLYQNTSPHWPQPDLQWIEDRFWTWVHYIAAKVARGEYFESIDALGMIRGWVLAPLLQIKNGNQPRGLRKLEMKLGGEDLEALTNTVPGYSRTAVLLSLDKTIFLYHQLRKIVFTGNIKLQEVAEKKALAYLEKIKRNIQ